MNKKLGVCLILVCLFICGCITHPYNGKANPNKKPGEMTIKYKILEVPLFAQETRMWCWAASGEMIMHYYGEEVPQHVQANIRFKRSDCGNQTRSIQCIKGGFPQFKKKYGFNPPKSKYGAISWQELLGQIHANQPVGFSWEWKKCKGSKFSGSHYMVARGYIILNDTRLVVVNDPLPMNTDKYKGGTVSIMTYDDYVQFCPRYIHSYTHYDIKKPDSEHFFKQKFLRGGLNQWVSVSVGQWVSSMIVKHSYESLIMMPRPHTETNENQHQRIAQHIGSPRRGAPGRRRQGIFTAALESLELLKALPWPILKELGFETKAMVKKSKLGKKPFYTLGMGSGRWQDTGEIPGDIFEVHYPVEVEKEPVTSITLRKRGGKWKFAVINDYRALSAVKTLDEMIAPRKLPSYFIVQIQSMNLSFLAYFLEEEEEEIEEDNIILYLVPTHEDPDLTFPLYVPVPAAEVFLKLKYLLEQMAEEKGGEALKNQFTGDWKEMDEALQDLDSGERTRALKGVQRLVEIINNVFGQLENQKEIGARQVISPQMRN
jgi:hypothetical protein